MKYKVFVGHISPPAGERRLLGEIDAPNAQSASAWGQEKVRELESEGDDAPKCTGTVQVERADITSELEEVGA